MIQKNNKKTKVTRDLSKMIQMNNNNNNKNKVTR